MSSRRSEHVIGARDGLRNHSALQKYWFYVTLYLHLRPTSPTKRTHLLFPPTTFQGEDEEDTTTSIIVVVVVTIPIAADAAVANVIFHRQSHKYQFLPSTSSTLWCHFQTDKTTTKTTRTTNSTTTTSSIHRHEKKDGAAEYHYPSWRRRW